MNIKKKKIISSAMAGAMIFSTVDFNIINYKNIVKAEEINTIKSTDKKSSEKLEQNTKLKKKDYTKDLQKMIDDAADILINIKKVTFFLGGEVVSLKLAGKDVPHDYLEKVKEKIRKRERFTFRGNYIVDSYNCSDMINGSIVAGEDPRNIEQYNLLEGLCKADDFNFLKDSKYAARTIISNLIAIDSGKFILPKDSRFTREQLINEVTSMLCNKDFGNNEYDASYITSSIMALSNYINDEKVKNTIDKAINDVNTMRNKKNGKFDEDDLPNTAKFIIGLCAMGIDPTSDKFTIGGNNLIDNLLEYRNEDGAFRTFNDINNKTSVGYTKICLDALIAYKRFTEGKKGSIYVLKKLPNKVDKLSFEKDVIKLYKGNLTKIDPIITPNYVGIENQKWTTSNDKIATVDDKGNVEAVKEGEATIKITIQDGISGEYKVKVVPKNVDYLEKCKNIKNMSINEALKKYEGNDISILADKIISLKLAGKDIPQDYLKTIEKMIKDKDSELFDRDGKIKNSRIIECAKMIMAIVALGKDPTNIGNYNLIEDLCSKDDFVQEEDEVFVTEVAYTLIALDSANALLPKDSKFTREKLVDILLSKQEENGRWEDDYDMSADVVIMALSNYQNCDKVKQAIDKGIKYIYSIRNPKDGHLNFSNYKVCQIIIAMCSVGIEPSDSRFDIHGYNLMDNFITDIKKCDNRYPEYSLMSSIAYERFKEGKKGLIFQSLSNNGTEVEKDKSETKDYKIENLTKVKEFKLGSEAKVTISAINKTDKNKDAALIVGVFNKEGKLINYGSVEQKINNGKKVDLTVTLKTPDKGQYKLKAFVWDSLEGMIPISETIEIPIK